jgi:ketosteroid isomerase-like protein
MTTQTTQTTQMNQTSQSTASADVAVVQTALGALAQGDLTGFGNGFHPDATWNHRNADRLGGIKQGRDAIVGFLVTAGQLTAGTLRPVPQAVMADGAGKVAVLVQVSGSRPDGRTFDNPQIVLFQLDGDRIRSADQFVGDPTAVAAFWA